VNVDYYVELAGHYYSAPYSLAHEVVDAICDRLLHTPPASC
jgi:hypothetical protein